MSRIALRRMATAGATVSDRAVARLAGRLAAVLAALALATPAAASDLRDPTRPPRALRNGPAPPARAPVRVSSILVSPRRRVAIVNDVPVSVGERVAGMRVVAIHEDRVELSAANSRLTLRLGAPGIKSRRGGEEAR